MHLYLNITSYERSLNHRMPFCCFSMYKCTLSSFKEDRFEESSNLVLQIGWISDEQFEILLLSARLTHLQCKWYMSHNDLSWVSLYYIGLLYLSMRSAINVHVAETKENMDKDCYVNGFVVSLWNHFMICPDAIYVTVTIAFFFLSF